MKFSSRIVAIAPIFVSTLTAGSLHAQMPSLANLPASSFIVLCDCATTAEQARVRSKIERIGGKVVYTYRQLNGFAVASRRPDEADRLERRLRGMTGVYLVYPDNVLHLNPPGLPQ